ncbi:hypothetical protein D9M71_724020 [compost metagenome]
MRSGLPVPMEKTFFEAVCIVMARSARCANIAEDEPIAAPLGIARVPVALLLVRRNAADSIDGILCISLADDEREICQWNSPGLRSSYLAAFCLSRRTEKQPIADVQSAMQQDLRERVGIYWTGFSCSQKRAY